MSKNGYAVTQADNQYGIDYTQTNPAIAAIAKSQNYTWGIGEFILRYYSVSAVTGDESAEMEMVIALRLNNQYRANVLAVSHGVESVRIVVSNS